MPFTWPARRESAQRRRCVSRPRWAHLPGGRASLMVRMSSAITWAPCSTARLACPVSGARLSVSAALAKLSKCLFRSRQTRQAFPSRLGSSPPAAVRGSPSSSPKALAGNSWCDLATAAWWSRGWSTPTHPISTKPIPAQRSPSMNGRTWWAPGIAQPCACTSTGRWTNKRPRASCPGTLAVTLKLAASTIPRVPALPRVNTSMASSTKRLITPRRSPRPTCRAFTTPAAPASAGPTPPSLNNRNRWPNPRRLVAQPRSPSSPRAPLL